MRLRTAQILARETIDRLMIVRPTRDDVEEKEIKYLEWWKYAGMNDHPLWRGSGAGTQAMPVIPSKPTPMKFWPATATLDWMRRVVHIISQLRPTRVEEYAHYLLRESIGTSAHHYRQRTQRDQCRLFWPERESLERQAIVTRALEASVSRRMLLSLYNAFPVRRRPLDLEEQIARLGIDAYLYNLCGAEVDLLSMVKNSDLSRYASVLPKKINAERVELTDSALRAWSASLEVQSPYLHKSITRMPSRVVRYIYIPNAGGKTWISEHTSLCVDMDVAVYKRVGWKRRTALEDDDMPFWYEGGRAAIEEARQRECNIVLGQWPFRTLDKAAERMNIDLQLEVLHVELDVIRGRLLARENFTEEKAEEYVRRAERIYNEVQQAERKGRHVLHWYTNEDILKSLL
jgi:hypothetical protein